MELKVVLYSLRASDFRKECWGWGGVNPPPSLPFHNYDYYMTSLEIKRFCILMNLCMRMSVCTRSNSTVRVKCPWLPFTMPNFHPHHRDSYQLWSPYQLWITPISYSPQVNKCIPAAWPNPTVYFSCKKVTLTRDKISQITLPRSKSRHRFPSASSPFPLHPPQTTSMVVCLFGAGVDTEEASGSQQDLPSDPLGRGFRVGLLPLTFIGLWYLELTVKDGPMFSVIFRYITKRKFS